MRSNGWDLEVRWRDRVGQVNYGIKLVSLMITRLLRTSIIQTDCFLSGVQVSVWADIYGYKVEGIAQTDLADERMVG